MRTLKILALIVAATTAPLTYAGELASYVDPMIGTAESPVFDPTKSGHGGTGNVYPGAVLPFGMVQFGPDGDHPGRLGYSYADQALKGFSLTHLSGAGCIVSHELLGYPLITPVNQGTAPPFLFEHSKENAEPGYYQVTLQNGVRVELTATPRTGFARMQFPDGAPIALHIQAPTTKNSSQSGEMRVLDTNRIAGWVEGGNFCDLGNKFIVFYALEFDSAIVSSSSTSSGITLQFDAVKKQPLQLKASISYVSEKNAWINLETEDRDWVFSDVQKAAKNQWNQALGKITVSGGSESDKKIFYTALYHSLLHPNIFSDVTGDYIGFDRIPHVTTPPTRIQYANFSGWDTYRTQIQLLSLLFPDRTADMMQSLVNDANQCGGLPRWPYNNDEAAIMVGDPGAILISSAYAFGVRNFDFTQALDWMKKGGTDPALSCNGHKTRPGLAEYLKEGFVPEGASGVWGSASTTLEYATADFAIARFARAVGDTKTSKEFLSRSAAWKNLFDPLTGYLRPKDKSGAWLPHFNASSGTGFVEGNSAQYTWMVPFDFSGLVESLGGNAPVNKRLDQFFTQLNVGENFPYFWLGDEPGFATPWIYNWTKTPSRTADVIHRSLKEMFSATPGGLPGNDDLGAMSAWYVWAALGLYPTTPGVGGFSIHPPLFSRAELHLNKGQMTAITADATSEQTQYIQSISLDGVSVTEPWIYWSKLKKAKELKFNLGALPSHWGTLSGRQ